MRVREPAGAFVHDHISVREVLCNAKKRYFSRLVLRQLHLAVGIGGVIAFLFTGQFMDRALDHLAGMRDLPRMMYRSAHIYLLFSALMNLVLGFYLVEAAGRSRRWLRRAGSVPVLLAPPVFLLAFFNEPILSSFERPYARVAIYGCLFGVILHTVTRIGGQAGTPKGAGTPQGVPYGE